MFFGFLNTKDSEGAILAHSTRLEGLYISKGTKLNKEHIKNLKSKGIKRIICARLDDCDVDENAAAKFLSEKIHHNSIRFSEASTGRVNIISNTNGLIRYNKNKIVKFNLVDEGVTLALLKQNTLVKKGQLIGTLKIIPYSIHIDVLNIINNKVYGKKPLIIIKPIRKKQFFLIQTKLSGTKDSVIESTKKATLKRIQDLNCNLIGSSTCNHEKESIEEKLKDSLGVSADIILISCASAVSDRRDILPSSIINSGGHIDHFGLPVDPGNLLLLGCIGNIQIVCLPGCARSPSLNGFDFIIRMLLADIKISNKEIAELSVGGLLKEVKPRPLPRKSINSVK